MCNCPPPTVEPNKFKIFVNWPLRPCNNCCIANGSPAGWTPGFKVGLAPGVRPWFKLGFTVGLALGFTPKRILS